MKSIEKLTDEELVQKYKEVLEVKSFITAVEKEIALRAEKGLEGVRKVEYQNRRVWKKVDLPKEFYVQSPMSVSEAEKKGLDISNLVDYKPIHKYIIENN